MQLTKHKNKIRWNQTEKCIIDPTLDFNKRLNVQSLNENLANTFKIYDLKGLKNRNHVPFLKVNCLWKTSVKKKDSTLQK